MDRTEFAKNINNYLTEYIKFGDAKAGVILTYALGLAGLGTSVVARTIPLLAGTSPMVWFGTSLLMLSFSISVLLSLQSSFVAVDPRLSKCSRESLCSFVDIASMPSEVYSKKMAELDGGEILSNYSNHNSVLSEIAFTKFRAIRRAVYWLRISTFLGLISGGISFILGSTGTT